MKANFLIPQAKKSKRAKTLVTKKFQGLIIRDGFNLYALKLAGVDCEFKIDD